VMRVRARPTDLEAAALSEEFADLSASGAIRVLDGPLPAEVRSDDVVDLPRLGLHFDRVSYARLHLLIDAINDLPTAPPMPSPLS
jgi:hypothetical protein